MDTRHLLTRRARVVAGTVAALALAAPATASAGTVWFTGDTLHFAAAPGEANAITLGAASGGRVGMTDGSAITPGTDRCAHTDATLQEVVCDRPAAVAIELADGVDRDDVGLDFPGDIPVEVFGGDGDDVLKGSLVGANRIALHGDGGNDTLWGYANPELLDGGAGNDMLNGGGGDDELRGGDGDDLLHPDNNDPAGNDVVDGGGGVDTVDDWYRSLPGDGPVHVSFDGVANDGRAGEADNVLGVEKVVSSVSGGFAGGAGADEFVVSAYRDEGASTIAGNGGDDHLVAGRFVESIDGGAGADTLEGGFGNDTLTGGPGRDTILGDSANPTCGQFDPVCVVPFGNDVINARDGEADSIDCGVGTDTAVVDAGDVVANCETVDRGAGAGPGKFSIAYAKTKLRAALRKGLAFRMTGVSGKVTVRVSVSKRTARKVKLGRRATKVGAGSAVAGPNGDASVRVTFTRVARKRLARLRKVTLTVAVGKARSHATLRR